MQGVRDQHPPRPDLLWAPCHVSMIGLWELPVGSQESVRFGEETDPETEDVQDTAAHSREDSDQTHEVAHHLGSA